MHPMQENAHTRTLSPWIVSGISLVVGIIVLLDEIAKWHIIQKLPINGEFFEWSFFTIGLHKNFGIAFDGDVYREINLSDRLKFESIWEIIIAAQGSNKWNLAALSNIFHISKISVRADIKSKLLAKLMELSRYQNNPHLLFCALLIRLELNDPFLIIKLFPGYDLGEYYRNQSRIYADIEESLPDKIKVIKVALKMLTPKQMQAVMAYYIDNDEKCSMDIISKRLKISKSALKERLDTAKRSMGIGFENYFKVMKIIDDLKR